MAVVEPQHVFYVDMNALRGDKVGTLLTHATSDRVLAQLFPPAVGDTVMVVDDEGDRYLADVYRIDGLWLGLTIRWDTFVPAVTAPAYGTTSYSVHRESVTSGA